MGKGERVGYPEVLPFSSKIKSLVVLKEWKGAEEEEAEVKVPDYVIDLAETIVGEFRPKLTYFVKDGNGEWRNEMYTLSDNSYLVVSTHFKDDDLEEIEGGKWSVVELEEDVYF